MKFLTYLVFGSIAVILLLAAMIFGANKQYPAMDIWLSGVPQMNLKTH